jgi:MerR family transcriptional regulator, mercuric resistance operon regulatory protein
MVRSQAEQDLTIAGLARAGSVGVETIRYYQRRGLLRTPERRDADGHGGTIRRYNEDDVRKLRFIKSAQAAGFKLDEIALLIGLDACDDRQRARQLAMERVRALDAQIAELKQAREALARLAQVCSASEIGPCPILAAFEHASK